MIVYKTREEIELMRKSAMLVGQTLAVVAEAIKPGKTTRELDTLAETFIRDHGATPSFKNYHGFPFSCCMSLNDAVVHGFATDDLLKEGDMLTVDVGVFMNGFHGDSAYTFAIGDPGKEALELMYHTKKSLYLAIEKAVAGNRVGDISWAVQEYCERKYKYGVVRELVGHGLGRQLHEDPQVPNYGKRGSGPKLKEGLVIAIEPMVNLGVKEVFYDDDGWTVRTKDGKVSAHYEHTVCIQKNKADMLSDFGDVEKAEMANTSLNTTYYSI